MAGLKPLPLAPPPLRLRVLDAVAGVPVVPTVTLTKGEDDLTGWETERRDELGPAGFEGPALEELGKGTADPEAADRAATISHSPFQLITSSMESRPRENEEGRTFNNFRVRLSVITFH